MYLPHNDSGILVRLASDSKIAEGGRATNDAGNIEPKDDGRRGSGAVEVKASGRNRKRTAIDLEGEGINGKDKELKLPAVSDRVRKEV